MDESIRLSILEHFPATPFFTTSYSLVPGGAGQLPSGGGILVQWKTGGEQVSSSFS